MPIGTGGLGIGGMVVLGLIGWALGIDPCLLISGAESSSADRGGYEQTQRAPQQDTARRTGTPSDETGQVRRARPRQHRGAVEGHLRARTARPIARRSS